MSKFKAFVVCMLAASVFAAGCKNKAQEEAAAKAKEDSLNLVRIQDSTKRAQEEQAAAEAAKPKTIGETATGTLATLVQSAELLDTLKGSGPFTVFIPGDQAFVEIQKQVDDLMKPSNKAKLQKVLTTHIVRGTVSAADLTDGKELTAVSGEKLKVKKEGDKILINGAEVTVTDVQASNGVIHNINKVLVPKKL